MPISLNIKTWSPSTVGVVVGEPIGAEVVAHPVGDRPDRDTVIEHHPTTGSDSATGAFGLPVDLDRWLLVGMEGPEMFDGEREIVITAHHFESDLVDPFESAAFAADRIRGIAAEIRPDRGDLDRTEFVLADHAGTGRGQSVPDPFDRIRGTVGDHLDPFGRGELEGGHDGPSITGAESVGEPVVHATVRGIRGGVRGVDGDSRGDGGEQDPTTRVLVGDSLSGGEDRGVVGDDRIGLLADRLREHRFGQVDAEHHPAEWATPVADQETDVVPGFAQFGGSDLLHEIDELLDSGS